MFEEAAQKGGRHSELVPGLVAEFYAVMVERAASVSEACTLLGVHEETRKNWLKQGKEDIAAGAHHTIHAQFLTLVGRAREELKLNIQWRMKGLAFGEESFPGNFNYLGYLLGTLYPEKSLEVQQHVAEVHGDLLRRLRRALSAEEYAKALRALMDEG